RRESCRNRCIIRPHPHAARSPPHGRTRVDLNLKGKVAIVTGASKGIGLAVTRALVAEGVRVVAGARTVAGDLEELAASGAVGPVAVDLPTPAGPDALVAHTAEFGGLDILVNNVGGVTLRLGGFASVTDAAWLASLNLNLLSAIRTTRAALQVLTKPGGSI